MKKRKRMKGLSLLESQTANVRAIMEDDQEEETMARSKKTDAALEKAQSTWEMMGYKTYSDTELVKAWIQSKTIADVVKHIRREGGYVDEKTGEFQNWSDLHCNEDSVKARAKRLRQNVYKRRRIKGTEPAKYERVIEKGMPVIHRAALNLPILAGEDRKREITDYHALARMLEKASR